MIVVLSVNLEFYVRGCSHGCTVCTGDDWEPKPVGSKHLSKGGVATDRKS